MGKKPKKPTAENPNSSAMAASDNIFKSLFGGPQQEPNDPTSVSLFSDSNPFRRKPTNDSQPLPQKIQEVPQLEVDCKSDTQIPNSTTKNLSKRKKEKLPQNVGSDDSDIEVEVKKSKRENGVVSESSKSLNFDEEGKKKKKRKKVEIEAEYEERKYGGVSLDAEEGEGEKEKEKVGEKRKKSDKGEDVVVPREGFDDEEKLLRTIFVGNLPLKVKKKSLLREFGQFGEVESVRIRSIPLLNDKTPRKGAVIKKKINDAVDRVNAYVVFKTEESAHASLSHNMAVVGGNHIHVDRACPPRKKLKGDDTPLYDSKRTVFIGNLPFDVKDEELYQLFMGIHNMKDAVEAIRVVRDPGTSMGKGIAYVLFKTREAANTVARKHKLKIRDRELRLSHARNSTKRKESPSANDFDSSAKRLLAGGGSAAYQGMQAPKFDVNVYNTASKRLAAGGGSAAYQGMRATKSGVQKKTATKFFKPAGAESRSEKAVKRKERTEKRPSVAARKAAANAKRTGGGGGGSAEKRKLESRGPQSDKRNKKPRKFR